MSKNIETLKAIKALATTDAKVNQLIYYLMNQPDHAVTDPKPVTYNHALSVTFSIGGSTDPQGKDLTATQLISALRKRVDELSNASDLEILDAIMPPYDSYSED